jgi:arginase family enzyme
MKTTVFFFPFDNFGSAGTGRGAELLADAVQEMLADNREEQMPARGHAYTPHVAIKEIELTTDRQLLKWRSHARKLIRKALTLSQRLVWATGNHLGVLPLFDELAGSTGETLVVQFDAHLDIFNLTGCESAPTHGNYLMHVDGPLPMIVNVGSRDLMLPRDHTGQYFHTIWTAAQVASAADEVIASLVKLARKARRIVIDLDCDAFDPAYFPGVLHPTPFGLAPQFLLRLLEAIGPERISIVAISEFAPDRDRHDQSLGTLLWLLEWLFLRWHENGPTMVNS